ncbi:MAG: type II toxin-antitoxin system mRNA interferase toxin, RelE/StbE family [Patescibacteria group bacterium]
MNVSYTPTFVRIYKTFPKELQEEIKEKITLFQRDSKHPFLKTHKLKGALRGRWSFSVNFEYRIVFVYASSDEAVFLVCGDHGVYT